MIIEYRYPAYACDYEITQEVPARTSMPTFTI
jgi:hypothetical protein